MIKHLKAITIIIIGMIIIAATSTPVILTLMNKTDLVLMVLPILAGSLAAILIITIAVSIGILAASVYGKPKKKKDPIDAFTLDRNTIRGLLGAMESPKIISIGKREIRAWPKYNHARDSLVTDALRDLKRRGHLEVISRDHGADGIIYYYTIKGEA